MSETRILEEKIFSTGYAEALYWAHQLFEGLHPPPVIARKNNEEDVLFLFLNRVRNSRITRTIELEKTENQFNLRVETTTISFTLRLLNTCGNWNLSSIIYPRGKRTQQTIFFNT